MINRETFQKRPFKIRNADEFDLNEILDLFVNPSSSVYDPFEFENTIVKGRMGSGKTMLLKANYAFHLYSIVPRLIEGNELVLPVFIRLSDFAHINSPQKIYEKIIIKIIEEVSEVYVHLQSSKYMVNVHNGIRNIPNDLLSKEQINSTFKRLQQLNSQEYISTLTRELNSEGKIKSNFLEVGIGYKANETVQAKLQSDPSISDIEHAYKALLQDYNGKILLLIDEAGSLDKKFFNNNNEESYFEVFMNQLRTASYIRTKIAIYPHSFSDIRIVQLDIIHF